MSSWIGWKRKICVAWTLQPAIKPKDHILNLIGNENIKFSGMTEHSADVDYLLWEYNRNFLITSLTIQVYFPVKKITPLLPVLTKLKVLVVNNDAANSRPKFLLLINNSSDIIEEIHLSKCDLLDDKVMKEIANKCPKLKNVYFPCHMKNNNTSEASIVYLTEKCKSLEVICLGKFRELSFKGLTAISKNCVNLKELSLRHIDLQYKVPTADSFHFCGLLEILRLNATEWITDDIIANIGKQYPNLLILDISEQTHCLDAVNTRSQFN